MLSADLEKLKSIVLQDRDLQAELKDITDRDEFTIRLIAIAKTNGLLISGEDVLEAINASRRAWVERWI